MVPEARRWLELMLGASRLSVPDDTQATAVLLCSEAATNAVVHTASGRQGTFTVHIRAIPGHLTVEVEDDGAATNPVPVQAGALDEHGRGLALIAGFADTWGPRALGCGIYYTLSWRPAPLDM
ncbi:ATP-binding protein [Streptomonospora nanhaiensis]|uniref:Anti-sigma regulatory factor (Ser/Thr protein kinase) n=1 Tax=Streptomonospora nanhaiensis TaxID=1323731 RepID=A0A853BTV7_9ACTN|nr:ATP-binding protein [Streptomonospora nanhaiensis]MBX9388323.1 ATP-binding protein [Streptomonospora nanhaiensis]NYI99259.1 anti-sigma regulatory factor (Ser/Thr protein kinase) [Streptomonospora nanhaiensis]